MKIKLLVVGKTKESYLNEGISEYTKRLSKFVSYSCEVIPELKIKKSLSQEEVKKREGQEILKKLNREDRVILLDEKGKLLSSVDFSTFLEKKMLEGTKNLVFIVGGAYGFSKEVYDKADFKVSLSPMTFSHQMIRLFFVEQLYRGFSILKGQPYHNV